MLLDILKVEMFTQRKDYYIWSDATEKSFCIIVTEKSTAEGFIFTKCYCFSYIRQKLLTISPFYIFEASRFLVEIYPFCSEWKLPTVNANTAVDMLVYCWVGGFEAYDGGKIYLNLQERMWRAAHIRW